jgi:2-hydroxycyclohexanecarboxyl-CoA dehydrogenase
MVAGEITERRNVLISGASGAIGIAISRRLHSHGWTVVLGYVSEERAEALARSLIEAGGQDGPEVHLVKLDMGEPSSAAASVRAAQEAAGDLDALVLNAGYSRALPFLDTDEELWKQTININFLGAVATVHACLPQMLANGGGAIVGVSSEVAKIGERGHAAYCASKAALAAFCRTIVREYGRMGIRANCVALGAIDTPMIHESYPGPGQAEAIISKIVANIPLGRRGHPDEAAEAIEYLLSARYVAGQHVSVGGGVTML